MSAAGIFVPPLIIFLMKIMKKDFVDGALSGSIGAVHVPGCITAELFERRFRHFISIVKPLKDIPIVLILDGCFLYCNLTHNFTVNVRKVIDLTRKSEVIIVCFPLL